VACSLIAGHSTLRAYDLSGVWSPDLGKSASHQSILFLPQGKSAVKHPIATGADLSRCRHITRTPVGERLKLSSTPAPP